MIYKVMNDYIIYSTGKIFSIKKGDYLKPFLDKDGYEKVSFEKSCLTVHGIIAKAFLGEPKNLKDPTVDHIDGNIHNNDVSNLRWLERGENSSRRLNKGQGELNHEAVLTKNDVIEICKLLQKGFYLKEIAKMFKVKKSTIANIKRGKTWSCVTKDFKLPPLKKVKSWKEAEQQRQEIKSLLEKGFSTCEIVKKGYPGTVVYRIKRKIINFGSTGV